MRNQQLTFGFIGLGQMGKPMATNLSKAHSVVVYDKDTDATAQLVEHGVDAANDLAVFSEVDVMILSLPSAETVQTDQLSKTRHHRRRYRNHRIPSYPRHP